MTTIVLIAFAIGAALLHVFAEAAFEALFGYIGARVVWLFTIGRIRLDPLEGGESVLATHIGVIFTALLAFAICSIVQRH